MKRPKTKLLLHVSQIVAVRNNNCYSHVANLLKALTSDLLGAGSGTVLDTLQWTLYYVARYEEVQARIFEEIETIVGFDRHPTVTDRNFMPYVQATFIEAMRCSNMVPILLPHS